MVNERLIAEGLIDYATSMLDNDENDFSKEIKNEIIEESVSNVLKYSCDYDKNHISAIKGEVEKCILLAEKALIHPELYLEEKNQEIDKCRFAPEKERKAIKNEIKRIWESNKIFDLKNIKNVTSNIDSLVESSIEQWNYLYKKEDL